MRKDMKFVVSQTSHSHWSREFRGHKYRDLEDAPSFESNRFRRNKDTCGNTQALFRYLVSQIGRPWDDVYSDISRWADSKSKQGRLVREAVGWMVDLTPKIGGYWKLYVDEFGILRDFGKRGYKDRWRKYVNPNPYVPVPGTDLFVHQDECNHIWYFYQVHCINRMALRLGIEHQPKYAYRRFKQLSKKELRQFVHNQRPPGKKNHPIHRKETISTEKSFDVPKNRGGIQESEPVYHNMGDSQTGYYGSSYVTFVPVVRRHIGRSTIDGTPFIRG